MSSAATDSEPNTPARTSGQWQPGQSGNPAGRPKGSRNYIVELQHSLEVAVREHIKPEQVRAILNTLVNEAITGNVKAAKLLLDKIIPNATAGVEDEEDRGRTVVFKIVNATFGAPQLTAEPAPEAIEAEFTAVAEPQTPPSN